MSENKINLVVPKDYNGKPIEVVLREGEAPVALDPKEPERVVISGTIDAPLRWLEKRVELINQKSTNIIVNRDKMGLALTIDETNYYQTGISGILQASKEMQEFGINTDKKWEPVFKGFACEEIEVEIYADVDGRDVSLSLVSAGANETIEEYKNKVIDEQIEAIKGVAPDIVIIEV